MHVCMLTAHLIEKFHHVIVNGGVSQFEALFSPLQGLGALLIGSANIAGIQHHPLVKFLGFDGTIAVLIHLLHELLLRRGVPSVVAKVGFEEIEFGEVNNTVSVTEGKWNE